MSNKLKNLLDKKILQKRVFGVQKIVNDKGVTYIVGIVFVIALLVALVPSFIQSTSNRGLVCHGQEDDACYSQYSEVIGFVGTAYQVLAHAPMTNDTIPSCVPYNKCASLINTTNSVVLSYKINISVSEMKAARSGNGTATYYWYDEDTHVGATPLIALWKLMGIIIVFVVLITLIGIIAYKGKE